MIPENLRKSSLNTEKPMPPVDTSPTTPALPLDLQLSNKPAQDLSTVPPPTQPSAWHKPVKRTGHAASIQVASQREQAKKS